MLQDFRFALRQLRRSPGFAAAAVLTLALGIGANTAIFSWVYAELVQALPYRQPDRLLVADEFANGRQVSVSFPDYLDWRHDRLSAFGSLAWFEQQGFNLSGAGAPAVVAAADVSGNFFSTLGVQPVLGRVFSAQADSAAAPAEAVLSYRLWQTQFGGASSALGATMNLDGRAYTVIGVLPSHFRDYNQTELFVPDGLFLAANNDRGSRGDSDVIARLAPGASAATAAAELRAEQARLDLAYPATDAAVGAVVRPMRALFVGNDAAMLWLLLAAVGLVLLLACANVANLMLVRTGARRQEWTVRAALGASRARLVRQLLIESMVVALGGGLGALAIGALALAGLRHLATSVTLSLNLPILAFTGLVTIAAAVLFGLGPARQAAGAALRFEARGGVGGVNLRGKGGPAGQRALVVAEVALAFMLAAGAGLMLKSFLRIMAVNPGFRPEQVLTFGTNLAGPRYASDATILAFERAALLRLGALPGVRAVGLGTGLPLTGDHSRSDVVIAGQPPPAQGHFPHPDFHFVNSGYLAALGLPLLAGRDISPDDTASSPSVALVNATFAHRFYPQGDAVGRQIYLGHHAAAAGAATSIVGVVGDTKLYGLEASIALEVYVPYQQGAPREPHFVLRAAVPPLSLLPAATAAVHALDAAAPITHPRTMNQVVAASVANPRATLWLLGIFGGLALLLAAIGIYGVISYTTAQRTNEIGVRMALGADGAAIARLIGGESCALIGLGIAAGSVGALLAGHLFAALLFGIAPSDPTVLTLVAALLAGVGLLGSAVPVGRAMRLAPWQALRRE